MADLTWTCDMCGGVFPVNPDWTEEDRVAEMKANIGDLPESDRARVCDDCYAEIRKVHPPAEVLNPIREAVDRGEPVQLEFNPKKSVVFKNVGEHMDTALILPAELEKKIGYAIGYQTFKLEMAIADWLSIHGGSLDDLQVEAGPNSAVTVRHKDGRLVAQSSGVEVKVVDE